MSGGAAIRWDDGTVMHIDGTGIKTCSRCGFLAEFMCDYPVGRGKTCDARLCRAHAIEQSRTASPFLPGLADLEDDPEKRRVDYCPVHDELAKRLKAKLKP